MQRILQNTPGTLTGPDYDGADPQTVTVTATRDDGTTLTTGTATGTGTNQRTFALTAGQTALLDRLTVTWVSATQGTRTTHVEIAGGFLFTVTEARERPPLNDPTKYPTAKIEAMRSRVEETIEDACGIAFVPRYDRATIYGTGNLLRISRPDLRTVRWMTVNTTTLTPTELAALEVNPAGFVGGRTWSGNVRVGFEHGMDRPPERVRGAALLLTRIWLVSGPVDDRVTSMSSPDTGLTAVLAVPGRGGSITGVPECDATIQAYRVPTLA